MKKKKEVISPERVLEELAAIGFAKATDLIGIQEDKVVLKDPEALPAKTAAAIASIERTGSGLKVKFYDKMRALELLGKHMGMFDGKMIKKDTAQSNLLELLLSGTQEAIEISDLQELQQTATACDDLVEPEGT